jgi:phospholipase/lecithinase/hemolysin
LDVNKYFYTNLFHPTTKITKNHSKQVFAIFVRPFSPFCLKNSNFFGANQQYIFTVAQEVKSYGYTFLIFFYYPNKNIFAPLTAKAVFMS